MQRKEIPFMLAFAGLPTLYPKVVEARTYAERMFHVVTLDPLSREETIEAISKPITSVLSKPGIDFRSRAVPTVEDMDTIYEMTHGYPYFIQYVCRELYDIWIESIGAQRGIPPIPANELIRKLDLDFFAGRWSRATDRQRDLLSIVARLPNCDNEFTVQEAVEHQANKALERPFRSSHVSQMLALLCEMGLVYKNRHGRYSFALPLFGAFIRRQAAKAS